MKKYKLINLHNDESEHKSFQLISVIRKEHPNCAIYKKNIATATENIVRTTLFTPKKRISKDVSADNHNVMSDYITKEAHLSTLLFYLKDISVSANDMNILLSDNDADIVGELSFTPYGEVLSNWINPADYNELSQYKDFGRCISQIKKNIHEEIQCAKEIYEKHNIKYFTFSDTIRVMDTEVFTKHYYELYRQLNKELMDCNILIKVHNDLASYGSMLHRKHLFGALVEENEDN